METITLSSSTAHNLKNRYHKFLKVCGLFNSKMVFVTDQNFFDVTADAEVTEALSINQYIALNISGEDESQAAYLIKNCIGC